ncbi:hypothetical protein [Pedobacter frigoris]|uniref:Uncharacterized protein n=1 Tax=Pedobacter frigoris TaxID=2571272 RepID=A0A4U1CF93_9SPHI|nr:hypothetical protein [Pedobacter frigoris]TKC05241.1 hypothetical protein FA047_15915 [Pedobacter frigoris]
MKKIYLLTSLIASCIVSFGQTNIFPASGNVGIGTGSPATPLHVTGGSAMTSGWNKTATLSATYPVLIFNSSNAKWAGIGYDYSSNLNFWVNASSDDVNGTGNAVFRIGNDGNIGMGHPGMSFKLNVTGEASITKSLNLTSDNQEMRFYKDGAVYGYLWSNVNGLHWGKGNPNNSITIDNNGNAGIGTNYPNGYKLAVAGNMIAESVKVKLQGAWPDYVFAPSYKVPTLQETEKHIKEKGHLPGIPSASEVKANGVDLGDMNAKLLQKIEELTLHLIEMQKDNARQNKEIELLKASKK